MRSSAGSWLSDVPLADPLQRQKAVLLQWCLILVAAGGLVGGLGTLTAVSFSDRLVGIITAILLPLMAVGAILLVRRGALRLATGVAVVVLIAFGFMNIISSGLEGSRAIFVALTVPIILAGLIGGRGILALALGLTVAMVGGVAVADVVAPGLVGFAEATYDPVLTGVSFVILIVVLAALVSRFGGTFEEAVAQARARERELEALRVSLEQQVSERTAALAQALADVQHQSGEQQRLLEEIAQQRETIRELSVPLLPVSATTLVMPLVGALDSRRLMDAQEQALRGLERTRARTLLIDLTGVPVVDTQVAQGLIGVVQAARLLGAEGVLIGIQPDVCQTIVALGIDLNTVTTARDLQSALAGAQGWRAVSASARR